MTPLVPFAYTYQMSIRSIRELKPSAIIQRTDGKLYRLVGYWTDPVMILKPIEADEGGSLQVEYICIGSKFSDELDVLVPKNEPL